MKPTLEPAGNLLVPVDESGTATGRPESIPSRYDQETALAEGWLLVDIDGCGRIEDDVAWVRESWHPGTLYRYDLEELPRLREIAAANLAYREKAAAQEAERAAREAEARSLDGWEATLSPMTLGRAQAVLMLPVLYRGRPMSRRDVVRLAVSEGALPGSSEGPTLDWSDGRFLRLPKLAVDYARHLVAKGGAL